MRKSSIIFGFVCIIFILVFSNLALATTDVQVTRNLTSMSLAFTENRGQWNEDVLFRASAKGATLWFTKGGAVYQFTRSIPKGDKNVDDPMDAMGHFSELVPDSVESIAIKASFVGANLNPKMVGADIIEYKCNYFIGNDPNEWHTDVPNYNTLIYEEVYEGIDLKYYGNGKEMEYDFIVSPWADPSQICIQYDGANSISVNDRGELVVETDWGSAVEREPLVYQVYDGKSVLIECAYSIIGENRFGFELVNGYDNEYALVIDPVLSYSTYLGGSDDDLASGVAVSADGCTYITGRTSSLNYPASIIDGEMVCGTGDAFVTKLSISGDSLVYSSFLCGKVDYSTEYALAIAVDGSGCAYITGECYNNFSVTPDAYDTSWNGGPDVFVAKLSAAGDSLIYSTYLGGTGVERGHGIAVDDSGHAYVVGETSLDDFPTTENAYDRIFGGIYDVFIAKISKAGDSLNYSTFLGGVGDEIGYDITIDDSGYIFVTGSTNSSNFPLINPIDSIRDTTEVYITRLTPYGDALVYSTFLGGSAEEEGRAIAVDNIGNAYITGWTTSGDFPVNNAYDDELGGPRDAFITKLSSSGAMVYSTYLGGSGTEYISDDIVVDYLNCPIITGSTWSTDFPVKYPYYGSNGGDLDAFVTRLSSSGESLLFSTYIGGANQDAAAGIAVDSAVFVYVAGATQSSDFPTEGAYQASYQGGTYDAFVAKLKPGWLLNTSPTQNELNVSGSTIISTTFIEDMDPASINDTAFVVHASQTGLHSGIISYDAPSRTATFDPDDDFAVGEVVTATLSGYIESDLGVQMGASYTWQFTVAVSGGSGKYVTGSTHGVSGKPFSIFSADLNADGAIDLVTADSEADSVSVLLNNGFGDFLIYTSYPTGVFPHSVYAADFDSDGDLDLVTANKFGESVSILKNNGFGIFEFDSNYVVDSTSTSVTAADLNGDGHPDLATTNIALNTISILINLGDGTFDDQYTYETGNAPHKVYAADLDNDADIDLVIANYTESGSVSIFLNEGDGTFSPKSDYSTGTHTSSVTACDLNEDGFIDLAAINWSDKTISILINIGNGIFAPESVYSIGGYSYEIISGDLDGDYDLDLAALELYKFGVSVLLNDGYGIFDSYQSYSVGELPQWIESGDFDGDGDIDLATANVGSYDVTVLLNINNIQVTNTDNSGVGSLRWAIDSANADPQPNDIFFDISGTIALSSELPAITDDNTRILGSTAPGKAHSVVIDGCDMVGNQGIRINSSNNVIEGLDVRNHHTGIIIPGAYVRDNIIVNNIVSDNSTSGIGVRGNNRVGGYESNESNLIYNNGSGITVFDDSAKIIGNQIDGNSIGIQGIVLGDLSFTLIDSNTISHNEKGITLYADASRNTITRNLIYLNDSLGIDLNDDGVTPNDSGDVDTGPNDLLNFPEIDSVYMNPDSSYTVYGTAAGNARVEFFVAHPGGDTALPADPSGYGEAYEYLGYTNCNLVGDFEYIVPGSAGQLSQITATATDTLGNTSEFSENFRVVPGPLIIVGYSYGGIKSGCPSNINLRVIDPNGNSIGYDTANIFYDEIPNADYTETTECNDSVYITNPLLGEYTVEVVGEPDALPNTYYSVGVRLDGTDEVVEVVDQSIPPQDSTDNYVYEVEENWHYINGDANRDSTLNIFDITFIISYLYLNGEAPWPEHAADANCDLTVNIFDITYLISFLYLEGDAPCR